MKNQLLTLLAFHLGLAAVVAQPVITNQPVSQTNIAGATVTFSVGATGTPPLSYQWVFNTLNNRLPGATNDTLILPNVQASNAGNYRVTITNAAGSVLSGSARLTVVTPPVLTPANPTASLFADVTLIATNISAGTISYQWLFNGKPIAGAVTNKLVMTNVQKTNAGNYAIAITYAFGSVTSLVATLKITPFNSMYCFGFSWTDTHNCFWTPTNQFYMGRACNGPMWPEFLSTNLGLAYAEANNYARCGANPPDILNQVTSFQVPARPELSLYCLMLGYPGDYSSETAWAQNLQQNVLANSNLVHQLYTRGARTILIESQFMGGPGEITPDLLTNPVWIAHSYENCDVPVFNTRVFQAVNTYAQTRADLRIVWADMYSRLGPIEAHPSDYGFITSTVDALGDTNLLDKSFTGPGADYVFWNSRHATSRVHKLMAEWYLDALTNAVSEQLEARQVNTSATVTMNHLLIGRDYTLQTSSDLTGWNDVQTFTAYAGTNQVTQSFSAGTASVFYRLQWQQ